MNSKQPIPARKLPPGRKARYIMIGGFLGAGKTTAIGRLASRLAVRGLRVGLITNDQGRNLVDTALLRSQGFATEEISGGCFCCRFDSLVEAAARLAEQSRPDVFIAEPVGSCTDLVATVAYPLQRLHGRRLTVAPVSVLVDPIRAARVFGLEPGGSFSATVLYIYKKQLEEADLIVISKSDLLSADRQEALRRAIAARYPRKEILLVSARDGTNLDTWFDRITREPQPAGKAMPVDYQVYADGEARLGWLNCTVQLAAKREFAAAQLLERVASAVRKRLRTRHAEVAHLKMTLCPDDCAPGSIGVANLVRNDCVPELSLKLASPVTGGQLVINLRAEAAPDILGTVVREALTSAAKSFPGLKATLDSLEHFRPGKPAPTHRFKSAG
jgi:G3E family GTPase